MKILVVEDDAVVREAISTVLTQEGFQVDTASDGLDGEWMAAQDIYDVIVLDIMLPARDGLAITQLLRQKAQDTAIILVTARDTVEDRVRGLDVGADDYLVKPFALSELLARIRAVLRRKGHLSQDNELHYGDLHIDTRSRLAEARHQPLSLSATEYDLLEFLLRNPERILTREQLFERVWGFDSEAGYSVVDVYIHYLRRKLTPMNCQHYIVTQRGVGFMLKGS